MFRRQTVTAILIVVCLMLSNIGNLPAHTSAPDAPKTEQQSGLARRPEDVFAGRILVSDQSYPRSARSEDIFISKVERQSKDRFQEDKDKKEWRVFIAAFFAKPVNDLEITIKIFDVTSGQRLVETFEQQVSDSWLRAYFSDLHMRRGNRTSSYHPNSKIHMEIESHGRVIAETTFFLIGEAGKHSGNVDFSDKSK